MTTLIPRVRRLSKNLLGRDFIIGDIHGAFDLLWTGMKAVNFNPAVDRLISPGDLIDRGENSYRCLGFMAKHYVFVVPGNHERMLVEMWKEGSLNRAVVDMLANRNFNGMGWMKNVPIEKLEEMAAAFDQLPYVLEIETERGMVGVLHADVPEGMDWKTFIANIETGDEYTTRMALGMDVSNDYHESRQRIECRREDGVAGIGRVFVGHTVLFDGMLRLGNVYALDSGATFGEAGKGYGHLTMVNPLMSTGYLSVPQERPNPLLDLRFAGDVPDRPFTQWSVPPSV
jgi:serine/threonine protein phosphatase 1